MGNSNDHIKYYSPITMEEVPSTTTVLKIFNKNLDGWANYMGLKGVKLKPYLEEKANLGTYIHSICEKFFSTKLELDSHPDLNYISVQDYNELKNRLQYVKDYMESLGYYPYATEYVVHGNKYGGTMDLLFYNPTLDDYILVDLKTAKGVYNTMYMQLMAYAQLLEEESNGQKHVSKVAILLILSDISNEYFLKFYDTQGEYCQHYLNIFNKLLDIYYILTDDERKVLIS